MIIYHITTPAEWQTAVLDGIYHAPSLHTEGFIHASTRAQVLHTAGRYFPGQRGLLLLAIDVQRVQPAVKFDPVQLPDGETHFPHIYGPLNLDAVIAHAPLEPDAQGEFSWPSSLPVDD